MKFSFVIPCYKASETISKTVGTILDQDFKDFEIICVLDGDCERTRMVLEAFPDVKVKVIEHGGACKARNAGLNMAKGDYVMFSDADFYWQPGILRTFSEKLDSTGADFVYCGYRWCDAQGGHVPPDFDEHLITVSNICDGSNPVKTSLVREVGGWDESLERFQDWDLWLRVVKAGGKGVKIDDVGKETPFPKEGDISGKDNFEKAYHIVRGKHDICGRPVCMTSIAAPGHALRVAKMCGWDYWHDPTRLPNHYQAIHLVGCFPESIDQHCQLFMGFDGKPRECVYIIHWIGTDVLNMQMMMSWLQIKGIREMFKKRNVVHLVQSEENAKEMREIGFNVRVLPLPVQLNGWEHPMPKKFTVACYDHNGVDQKWHKWLIMELTKAMPDVDFIFFGNKNAVGKEGNTEWLGRVQIEDVIKRSSALIRLTIHDGYPVSTIEFLLSGRPVVTNVKDMKFTEYVDIGVVKDDRVAEIKNNVIDAIRKVQKANRPIDVQEVKDHYAKMLCPKTFKAQIEEIIGNEKAKS